jgi:hypothetical protein
MKIKDINELEKIANNIRKNIIKAVYNARFRASRRFFVMCRYINCFIF